MSLYYFVVSHVVVCLSFRQSFSQWSAGGARGSSSTSSAADNLSSSPKRKKQTRKKDNDYKENDDDGDDEAGYANDYYEDDVGANTKRLRNLDNKKRSSRSSKKKGIMKLTPSWLATSAKVGLNLKGKLEDLAKQGHTMYQETYRRVKVSRVCWYSRLVLLAVCTHRTTFCKRDEPLIIGGCCISYWIFEEVDRSNYSQQHQDHDHTNCNRDDPSSFVFVNLLVLPCCFSGISYTDLLPWKPSCW